MGQMIGKWKIEEKIPVRRSSVRILRDMLILLQREDGLRYSEWLNLALEENVLVRQNGDWASDSTFWNHLNALRILRLAKKTDERWIVTELGSRIARVGHLRDKDLSEQTRRHVTQAILASPFVRRNFLILFTGHPEANLFENPKPISHFRRDDGQYVIITEYADEPIGLNYSQIEGLVWGIRLWCLETGLMDEIYLPPRSAVPPDKSMRLFPVWKRADDYDDLEQFTATLRRYLADKPRAYGETIKADIPLLLWELCPGEGLNLSEAKKLLWSWLETHKSVAFAEATSSPAVPREGHQRRRTAREKQLATYLEKHGALYSVLFVNAEAWRKVVKDDDGE